MTQHVQILQKEEVTQGQEKKPDMYVSEAGDGEPPEEAIFMKRWTYGEPAQKQVGF